MRVKMRFKPEGNHSRSTGGGDWLPVLDWTTQSLWVWSMWLEFEAWKFWSMWQSKGQHRKQCDHDCIPPSKNAHGSVSMQSHKEKSLGQSPRSILERWNSSQSQSLPAPASAATVLHKKGNKSKQVRRSSTKVKNAKQAKVESTMK